MPQRFGYLTTKEYADLTGISERTVQQKIKDEKIFAIAERSNTGRGGVIYRIPIQELSPEGMIKYFKLITKDPDGDKELIYLPNSKLLLPCNSHKREQAIKRLNIARMAAYLPFKFRNKKREWYKYLSDYSGLSVRTIQGDLSKYKTVGPVVDHYAHHERNDKGKFRVYDEYAIDVLLKTYFSTPHSTIKSAWEKTKAHCEPLGYKVGSCRSTQRLIQSYDKKAALRMYRDEGIWALKNKMAPPILRDYNDLQVNDVWVGDQHRFNHWVIDNVTKQIFRPEGFAWMDIKSRYLVGFDITKHYNSQTVASALIRGIIPTSDSPVYGIPKMIYTDWGRPELSKYMQGVKEFGTQIIDDSNQKLRKILRRYNSDEIEGIITELGIEPRQAIVRNPQAKPIERWFETLDQRILNKGVPGYTGNIVGAMTEADKDRLNKAKDNGELLTFSEFYKVVAEVINKYNMSEHKGTGMYRRSPLQVWTEAYQHGYRPKTIDKHALEMLLLPWESRVVQRDGVHYNNRIYRHPKLNHIIGENIRIAVSPDNINKAIILKEYEYICDATVSKFVPFNAKNEIISEEIAKQREWIKQVVERYDEIVAKNGEIKYIKSEHPGRQKKEEGLIKKELDETLPIDDITQEEVWKMLEKQMIES